MDILQKIREIYPSLTRKQKSIADYLLENPEDICYITLAQLSRQTCASELTLLRFCAKLGCSGFLELKQEFREHTQQMIRLLSAPAFFVPENASDSSAKTELLYELCRQEAGAAADFAAIFQPEAIIAAAQEIRKSRRIFIFAHDISKVPGEFLKSRLLLLSFQVTMIDLADLEKTQEYLQHLQDGDLVVFFSFPKYYYPMGSIAKKAADAGVPIAWSSSNETVATVSDRGLVTGVGYGAAIVTARYGSYMARCSVTLNSEQPWDASQALADETSLSSLTMNDFTKGASVSPLSPWMYAESSTPCSCTASIIPESTKSAITSGSSSTNTPTFVMERSRDDASVSAVSFETHLLLGP